MWIRWRPRPRATAAQDIARVHGRLFPTRRAAHPSGQGSITWMALSLMTVGSVGNLGSDPPLAVLGLASVFLYVLPALVFLLPITLVAAELASGWPGGVFNWVEQGISPPMGLLAIWCQFAQTFFFYPALLAPAIILRRGAVYLLHGNHSDAPMTADHLLPPWHGLASIVLIISSFFTYAGIEVNAVHVNH